MPKRSRLTGSYTELHKTPTSEKQDSLMGTLPDDLPPFNNEDRLAAPSSNHMDDVLSWHFSSRPAVVMRGRVMEGIDTEAMAAPHSQTLQRLEVGGILLGHRDEERILIEDFEPVLCDHCFGPSYLLVGEDRVAMEETLNWFRHGSSLSILGWYRSITRPDFALENEAIDLLLPTPLDAGDVALLLFPLRPAPDRTQFLFKGEGELLEAPLPVWVQQPTSGATAAATESAADGSLENKPRGDAQIVLPVAEPSPHPLPASSHKRRQGWLWLASAVVFGAILASVSVNEPKRSSPRPAALAVPELRDRDAATKQAQEKGQVAAPPPGQESADRMQPANMGQESAEVQIRNFLDRWAEAAKAGDIERAANMYAERLSTFFTKRNATRADVHQERNLNLARYGRMSVYRISDLQMRPISENQVSVTFRKLWRSSGPRISSGEEKEQLTLVRDAARWQIVAEKEIKLYWMRTTHLPAR